MISVKCDGETTLVLRALNRPLAMPAPSLDAITVRRTFLARQRLAAAPTGRQTKGELLALIDQLGFVQVDSIASVERAHHMILQSRNQTYRRSHLDALLERDRTLFENWTHDASIIPTRFFPYWRRRFAREAEALRARWNAAGRTGFEVEFDAVLERIARDGPVLARQLAPKDKSAAGGWWDWHPSKVALEYLWRTGQLAVTRREGFQKVYDLTERVIPDEHRRDHADDETVVDWACRQALQRLGAATAGELAAFWGLVSAADAKSWAEKGLGITIPRAEIAAVDGSRPRTVLVEPDVLELRADEISCCSRIRVISPFDPVIRDRKRLSRLFGFDYRIEVFVPEEQRRYGYYVFPLLEGDRFVGRIDMKCRRDAGTLAVRKVWWEPGIKAGRGRMRRLEAELDRVRRFAGVDTITFETDWQ